MTLDNKIFLNPIKIEYTKDNLGSNALSFREPQKYFSISVSLFLEGDDLFDSPHFEYCDQANSQYGGLQKILIKDYEIEFQFDIDCKFCQKTTVVRILLKDKIERNLVDFMINYLFLKEFIVSETISIDVNDIVQINQRT